MVWAIGGIVAVMTAFYMFRLMGLTFWGKSRVDPEVEPHIHESPRSMTIPLIILAIPSIFLGIALGLPFGAGLIDQWLDPVFHEAIELAARPEVTFQLFGLDGALILSSVAARGRRHRRSGDPVRLRVPGTEARRQPRAGPRPDRPIARSSTAPR